ncbi:MAG: hypothetical protein C0483_19325 [Pirellula sp.]|nr:hypothetical protein [Pirellula sp.]
MYLCGATPTVAKFATILRRRLPGLRRGVALVALLNYLAQAVGLPLPSCSYAAMGAESGSSMPHPCSGHRCGCDSAEQCWKSCCCYSPAEKLAWARRNNITPPAYVVAESEVRPKSTRSPVRNGCCTSQRVVSKSCCSTVTQESAPRAVEPHQEPRGISYFAAARCRGVAAAEWFNVPVSLPIVFFDGRELVSKQVQPLLPIAQSILTSASLSMADPPPRVV